MVVSTKYRKSFQTVNAWPTYTEFNKGKLYHQMAQWVPTTNRKAKWEPSCTNREETFQTLDVLKNTKQGQRIILLLHQIEEKKTILPVDGERGETRLQQMTPMLHLSSLSKATSCRWQTPQNVFSVTSRLSHSYQI